MTAVSRLPLPPPLPYSPDSIPFRRHLDILQQSLTTHPDESWLVYQSLHPSLKRYIPNRTYVALISQQSNLKDLESALTRVEELLGFAEECGMQWEELGETILRQILRLGTDCAAKVSRETGRMFDISTLRQVWGTICRLYRNDLGRVPSDARRTWFDCLFVLARNNGTIQGRKAFHDEASTLMLQLLPIEESKWLRDHAGPLISMRFVPSDFDVEARLARVRQLAYLHARGVEIDSRCARQVISAVRRLVRAQQHDISWDDMVRSVTSDVVGTDPLGMHERGTQAWIDGLVAWTEDLHKNDGPDRYAFTTLKRARATLANPNASTATIIAMSLPLAKILHKKAGSKSGGKRPQQARLEPVAATNVLLGLFERVAHRALADPHVMVAVITRKLIDYHTAGEPTVHSMILRFTRALLSSDLLGHIDSKLVHLIFDLLVDISSSSEPAYDLARRVYSLARSTESPYTWTSTITSRKRWRRLFRSSLQPSRGHMHFASRLYADRLADGQTVSPFDMLFFIRAIGSQDGLSKYVLLERHLKDYLYFEYSSLDKFVWSLVKGLTARGRGREAWLGFHLSLRIMGSKPLQDKIYFRVIKCFSESRREQDFRYSFGVLEYLDKDSTLLPKLYDLMFSSLLQKSIEKARDRNADTELVTLVVDLMKHLAEKEIKPSMLGMECFLRILIAGGYHDRALQSLERMIRQSPGNSNDISDTIARIVLELVQRRHFEDAKKAFDQYWRVQGTNMELSPEWQRVRSSLTGTIPSAGVEQTITV